MPNLIKDQFATKVREINWPIIIRTYAKKGVDQPRDCTVIGAYVFATQIGHRQNNPSATLMKMFKLPVVVPGPLA